MVEDLIKTTKNFGYSKADIGVVGFSSTRPQVVPDAVLYRSYSRIIHELPEARFQDSSGLLDELRMIKSPEEITMLRKASQLADAMYEAMVQSARPGVRESEVYANMLQALVAEGGEEDMIWLSSGPHPPPHASKPPSSIRRLELGDILVVEYHSNYCGYISGIEHSMSIGEPKKEYKEIHDICRESQKSGIEKMWAGNSLLEVVDAFRSPILEAGMDFVECGIHGHGLASPEFPSCMYGGLSKEWGWHPYAVIPPIELRENMVFGTASDVFNPNWKDNSGLMLGDTVLVTTEGPIKLCRAPFELTVV
jgi:Xaa-Pro aminopeptidase